MYRRWEYNFGSDVVNNSTIGNVDLTQFDLTNSQLHFEIFITVFDISNILSKGCMICGDIFEIAGVYRFTYNNSTSMQAVKQGECSNIFIGNSLISLEETVAIIESDTVFKIQFNLSNIPDNFRYGAWGNFIIEK